MSAFISFQAPLFLLAPYFLYVLLGVIFYSLGFSTQNCDLGVCSARLCTARGLLESCSTRMALILKFIYSRCSLLPPCFCLLLLWYSLFPRIVELKVPGATEIHPSFLHSFPSVFSVPFPFVLSRPILGSYFVAQSSLEPM